MPVVPRKKNKPVRDTFLLITHSRDYYCIDLVKAHLEKKGFRAIRLNADEFPVRHKLSWRHDNENTGFTLNIGRQTLTSENLRGTWIRKLLFPLPDETIDPAYRAVVANENQEICRNFLVRLSTQFMLDGWRHTEAAEDKPRQWYVAAQCGLDLPRTLIANSLKEARTFMRAAKTLYVTKLLRPNTWGMEGDSGFFYTHFIQPGDLQAEHFAIQPLLIQEFIPKQYELRIAYVGGQCFTGKLEVSEYEADWRVPGSVKSWAAYTLPKTIQAQLKRFMKKMNLDFGAIDLIRGSNGKYYFLEVNPIGEWGMLEKFLDLPVSAAIADHLIKMTNHEK